MMYAINNMDMIKISHVMTIDTNEHRDMLIVYVYNFVFNVYNIR